MTNQIPQNIEAEQSVLGSILINPDCYSEVKTCLNKDSFHHEKHGWIFEAMDNIAPAIDQITVSHELQRIGKLEAIGGVSYLSRIVANTPTSINADYYAGIVADCYYQRQMIEVSGKIAGMAYSGEGGPEEISSKAIQLLSKLNPPGKHSIITPKEHADQTIDMVTERRDKVFDSIPYGYQDLDNILYGMFPGDLVIFGARPSIGKSQVLLEIAHSVARRNKPVLFSAVEMSLKQVSEREIAMGSSLSIRDIRKGVIDDNQWGDIQGIVEDISKIPLYFICGKCSVATIRQRATVLKQTVGLSLVVVDYLQLLRDKNDKSLGRDLRERTGYISGELKNIALDLDVTVLAASQLNREPENRDDKKPKMGDLRESGDLEQDADVIILLHRPEVYQKLRTKENTGLLEIAVAKVRQGGQRGECSLKWNPKKHRYEDQVK